ncbi:MAG: hypothetical protein ACT4OX_01875 [Actinomycetota bacterium]
MDNDGIFLIRNDDLVVLREQPYESEALLQEALARYPAVLAGGATSGETSGRLLLVRREMSVPSSDSSGGVWSADHLFLDDQGVPVIVEVKRSSDTRIRREVVGQMLDYAANAVKYWPIDTVRSALDATASKDGTTTEVLLHEHRPDLDPEEFWKIVADNLSSGRIRMVFVADKLPPELVRIIEFLNEQLKTAEVLGVTVPQFVGEGVQVLVPRVVGATQTAATTKQAGIGTAWDESSFLAAAGERCSSDEFALIERLFAHEKQHGSKFSWGHGISPGVSGWYEVEGASSAVWTTNAGTGGPNSHAYMYLYAPELRKRISEQRFATFIATLETIPAFKAKIDEARAEGFTSKYLSVYLDTFAGAPEHVDALFKALDQLLS